MPAPMLLPLLHDGRLWYRAATPARAANAFQVWRSFQRAKRTKDPRIGGLPISVSIEPTTACNLRCPECPSGLRNRVPSGAPGTSDLGRDRRKGASELVGPQAESSARLLDPC